MSTILDALKRAEQNCADQRTEKSGTFSFNTRKTLNLRMRRQQRQNNISSKRVIIFIGILGVLVFCFLYVMLPVENKKQFMADPQIEFDENQKSTKKILFETNPSSEAAQDMDSQFGKTNFLSAKKIAGKNENNKIVDVPGEKSIKIEEEPNQLIKEDKIIDNIAAFSTEKEPKPKSEIEHKDRKEPIYTDVLPIENDILKIQAISWSANPSERVAVVNDKVLSEGDFINGYHLLEIQKDQIILQNSGHAYNLEFKYR